MICKTRCSNQNVAVFLLSFIGSSNSAHWILLILWVDSASFGVFCYIILHLIHGLEWWKMYFKEDYTYLKKCVVWGFLCLTGPDDNLFQIKIHCYKIKRTADCAFRITFTYMPLNTHSCYRKTSQTSVLNLI